MFERESPIKGEQCLNKENSFQDDNEVEDLINVFRKEIMVSLPKSEKEVVVYELETIIEEMVIKEQKEIQF